MKNLSIAGLMLVVAFATMPARADEADDVAQVKAVLQAYSQAVEKLDGSLASPLFAPDAHIFEQGGDEGTWPTYLKDHLGPEFAEFSSFTFADYASSAIVEGDLAFAWETYRYTLVVKATGEKAERLGAATSVLKRTTEGWKIVQYHSSSRKPPA